MYICALYARYLKRLEVDVDFLKLELQMLQTTMWMPGI